MGIQKPRIRCELPEGVQKASQRALFPLFPGKHRAQASHAVCVPVFWAMAMPPTTRGMTCWVQGLLAIQSEGDACRSGWLCISRAYTFERGEREGIQRPARLLCLCLSLASPGTGRSS